MNLQWLQDNWVIPAIGALLVLIAIGNLVIRRFHKWRNNLNVNLHDHARHGCNDRPDSCPSIAYRTRKSPDELSKRFNELAGDDSFAQKLANSSAPGD